MIKTIIFDLSEVYLNGYKDVEKQLEKEFNITGDDFRDGRNIPEFQDFMKGTMSEDDFWHCVILRNKLSVEVDVFKKAIRKNFSEISGTREIIESLKHKGYKLGLLSDHSREWIDFCEREFDYHKLFHSIQYSFEVGVCKTDKNAFHLLLKKLNERPENCLFIDDSKRNIALAKSLGFNVIKFETSNQLKEELKKNNLLL